MVAGGLGGVRSSVHRSTPIRKKGRLRRLHIYRPGRLPPAPTLYAQAVVLFPRTTTTTPSPLTASRLSADLAETSFTLWVANFPLSAAIAATSPLMDWILHNQLHLLAADKSLHLDGSTGRLWLQLTPAERRTLNIPPNVSLNSLTRGHRRQLANALARLCIPPLILTGHGFSTAVAVEALENFNLKPRVLQPQIQLTETRDASTVDIERLAGALQSDDGVPETAQELLEFVGRVATGCADDDDDESPEWLQPGRPDETLVCVRLTGLCLVDSVLESVLRKNSVLGGAAWCAMYAGEVRENAPSGESADAGVLRLWSGAPVPILAVRH